MVITSLKSKFFIFVFDIDGFYKFTIQLIENIGLQNTGSGVNIFHFLFF